MGATSRQGKKDNPTLEMVIRLLSVADILAHAGAPPAPSTRPQERSAPAPAPDLAQKPSRRTSDV